MSGADATLGLCTRLQEGTCNQPSLATQRVSSLLPDLVRGLHITYRYLLAGPQPSRRARSLSTVTGPSVSSEVRFGYTEIMRG